MKIVKSRIRSVENYLIGLNNGEDFFVAFRNFENKKRIEKVGFTNALKTGDTILPNILGPVSNYNSNGSFELNKTLPKEMLYKLVDITDWHGNYHTVEIPYKRYHRNLIPAPSIELMVVIGNNDEKIIRSPKLTIGRTPNNEIMHVINLFLELFGECETIRTNLIPVFNLPINRLNWEVLPPGNYPFEILNDRIRQLTETLSTSRRRLIERRLVTIRSHNPNFVAIGESGFRGYIIFGYPNKKFFLLESLYFGNATYVFGHNWRELSQMTKAEIIHQNLQQERLIHNLNWTDQINSLF